MSLSPLDSDLYRGLLGDPAIDTLFGDAAVIARLLEVEAALALAQAETGTIPREAGAAIAEACGRMAVAPAELGPATASAGVPVAALVSRLRQAAGEAGAWVHWGATSQDIVDTGFVLGAARALKRLAAQLDAVIGLLADLAEAHAETVMVGRTRWQQGVPITFGLKVANWLDPLLRTRDDLAPVRARVLVSQLGGAAGSRSALGARAAETTRLMARRLGLGLPDLPWHSSRDRMLTLGAWLASLTGSLGRIGQDVVLLSQMEIGELRIAGGGGSSTMPHKANPVAAEMLVAASRTSAGLLGTLAQSLLAEQERSGIAWTGEWLTLPPLVGLAGGALVNARRALEGLHVDAGRMAANLAAGKGLVLAEALTFALARHLPRDEAAALVGQAAARTSTEGIQLVDAVLASLPPDIAASLDRDTLADPANAIGDSAQLARATAARA
ncbi:MAG: 3-carboxy-cis,cis-muconate cycloisomerase [Azospirillaceae bacterium]